MKSFSDRKSEYMLFTSNRGKGRVWLGRCQSAVLTEECHQLLEGFMDLKSLELGLTALKGHYMTGASDEWFIYLQCYSSQVSFAACYLKTMRGYTVAADVSECK